MSNQTLSSRLNVGVAQIVSSAASGLMPASNTSLDNGSATRLGLMQYLHGGSYNGGLAPTLTLSSGGGTLSSVTRAVFIPYQMNDGTWRMRMTAAFTLSSASRTTIVMNIAGVTFKDVSSWTQPIVGFTGAVANSPSQIYVSPNTGNVEFDMGAQTTAGTFFSGDVELDSKPTWAY